MGPVGLRAHTGTYGSGGQAQRGWRQVVTIPNPLPTLAWPLTSVTERRRAVAAVVDWPTLIEQAAQQNVLGLLAAGLRRDRIPEVPPEAMAALDHRRAVGAARALRMSAELLRLLDVLETAGIETMPVKGPTVAQDVYGDPTLRAFSDIDIVVRPADARRARAVLLAHGYSDQDPYNERILRRGLRSEGEIPMIGPTGGLMVDLHWLLTVGYSSHSVPVEHVFANTRTLQLLDQPVRAPSVEDQLLLAALHGSRHDWVPLELRLQIAIQVVRMPRTAWSGLCATARRLGCLRRFTVGVAHGCRPFGVPVPPEVTSALSRDRLSRGYQAHLASAAAGSLTDCGRRSRSEHLAALGWRALGEDRPLAALDHALIRSLLPGPQDWALTELPYHLEVLYWAVRPLRLLRKYGLHGTRR